MLLLLLVMITCHHLHGVDGVEFSVYDEASMTSDVEGGIYGTDFFLRRIGVLLNPRLNIPDLQSLGLLCDG